MTTGSTTVGAVFWYTDSPYEMSGRKHGFDFAASAWMEMDVLPNRVRDFAIFRRRINRGENLEPGSLEIANPN